MIEVRTTQAQRAAAEAKLAGFRESPASESHQFGAERERTFFGYLGERVVCDYLGAEDVDDPEFDILYNGRRIDVKTVACTSIPREHYLVTVNSCVPGQQRRQACEFYFFVRVHRLEPRAWILGWISSSEFWERGTFVPRGEELRPGQIAEKADATTIPISALRPVPEIPR